MLKSFCSDIIAYFEEHPTKSAYGETIHKTISVIVDPSAASFIALLRQSKEFTPISANNDVLNGIRNVSTCMSQGKFKVHDRCENFKKEAQSYVWDSTAPDDRPIKDNDHLMDAMRYFINTKRLAKIQTSYDSRF